MGAFLFMFLLVIIGTGIMAAIFRSHALDCVYSGLVIVCFGIYLIYDVQLMMGDKKNFYSVDDYIIAALNIYIDIIRLFIEILKILNRK